MIKKQWNNRNKYTVGEKDDEKGIIPVYVCNYIKNLQVNLCFGHAFPAKNIIECLSGFEIKEVFYEVSQLHNALKKYYPTKYYNARARNIENQLLSIAESVGLY